MQGGDRCHRLRARNSRRSGRAGRSCVRSTCHRRGDRPASTVQGVHHLALICKNVEETIQFYQEFLGFPLVELVENRDYAGLQPLLLRHRQTATCSGSSTSPATSTRRSRRPSAGCSTWPSPSPPAQFGAAKKKLDDAGVDYLGPDRGVEESMYFPRPERGERGTVPGGTRHLRRQAPARLTSSGAGVRGFPLDQARSSRRSTPGRRPDQTSSMAQTLLSTRPVGRGHLPHHVLGHVGGHPGPPASARRSTARRPAPCARAGPGNWASNSSRQRTNVTITSSSPAAGSPRSTSAPDSAARLSANPAGPPITRDGGPPALMPSLRGSGVPE